MKSSPHLELQSPTRCAVPPRGHLSDLISHHCPSRSACPSHTGLLSVPPWPREAVSSQSLCTKGLGCPERSAPSSSPRELLPASAHVPPLQLQHPPPSAGDSIIASKATAVTERATTHITLCTHVDAGLFSLTRWHVNPTKARTTSVLSDAFPSLIHRVMEHLTWLSPCPQLGPRISEKGHWERERR